MRRQQGGSGGTVVCLGVGGLVDMSNVLGLDSFEPGEDPSGGVEVWLIDARRPWNLGNVFGGDPVAVMMKGVEGFSESRRAEVDDGQLTPIYRPGQGGIIIYDDGDIEQDLMKEREAYCELAKMNDLDDIGEDSGDSGDSGDDSDVVESIEGGQLSKKRKSWSGQSEDGEENDDEEDRPRRKRRSNSVRMVTYYQWYVANAWARVARYPCPPVILHITTCHLHEHCKSPLKHHLRNHELCRHDYRNNRRFALFAESSSAYVKNTHQFSKTIIT